MEKGTKKKIRPKQEQRRPGLEEKMNPIPKTEPINYPKGGKLKNKVTLITGGDSGIGKSETAIELVNGAFSRTSASESAPAGWTRAR